MKALVSVVAVALVAAAASADPLRCDLGPYVSIDGLDATVDADVLTVTLASDDGADLRMRFVIEGAQPIVRELAIRRQGSAWATLGQDLTPEYRVTSGIRRLSFQQSRPLEANVRVFFEVEPSHPRHRLKGACGHPVASGSPFPTSTSTEIGRAHV